MLRIATSVLGCEQAVFLYFVISQVSLTLPLTQARGSETTEAVQEGQKMADDVTHLPMLCYPSGLWLGLEPFANDLITV